MHSVQSEAALSLVHWRLSQSERCWKYNVDCPFFNNLEEVVKRFTKAYLEMGV